MLPSASSRRIKRSVISASAVAAHNNQTRPKNERIIIIASPSSIIKKNRGVPALLRALNNRQSKWNFSWCSVP